MNEDRVKNNHIGCIPPSLTDGLLVYNPNLSTPQNKSTNIFQNDHQTRALTQVMVTGQFHSGC